MAEVLLHVCCGPCSIMPAKMLRSEGLEPAGWMMNPNIHPLAEYLRRREAAGECAERLGMAMLYADEWDLPAWLEAMLPHAKAADRCQRCCGMRLEAAAAYAKAAGFKKFSTSLLYSRYQPHDFIRAKGEELAAALGLEFIYRDFRAGWQEGIDISKAWGVYRQPYCGCVFSEAERYAKKLARLRKTPQASVDKA